MGFAHLVEDRDRALLESWLRESGEVYLDFDRPHSGGLNNSIYLITDFTQLERILDVEEHREVCLHFFRHRLFPIRGVFDQRLLTAAVAFAADIDLVAGLASKRWVRSFADCRDDGY